MTLIDRGLVAYAPSFKEVVLTGQLSSKRIELDLGRSRNYVHYYGLPLRVAAKFSCGISGARTHTKRFGLSYVNVGE